MKALLSLVAILSLACGGISPVAPSGDPREQHVLDETSRFAALLGVSVRGVLTDHVYMVRCSDGSQCPAAGWYKGGTAYYWRPNLLKKDLLYGTALAAHEVCHVRHHDEAGADACAGELLR